MSDSQQDPRVEPTIVPETNFDHPFELRPNPALGILRFFVWLAPTGIVIFCLFLSEQPITGLPFQEVLAVMLGIGMFLSCAWFDAMLAFLFSEAWLYTDHPERWLIWLSGKSITGALPGGWAGVEIMKRVVDYKSITGDRFAVLIPIPLALGRVGCLHAGCCRGSDVCGFIWPSIPVEIGFQLLALAILVTLKRRHLFQGQLFHLYLIAYGLFRFSHEFLRDTPKPFLGLSGYQMISLFLTLAASFAFVHRRKKTYGIS